MSTLWVLFSLFVISSADADVRWSALLSPVSLSHSKEVFFGAVSSSKVAAERSKRSGQTLTDERFLDFSFAAEPQELVVAKNQKAYLDCQPTFRILSADLRVEWRKDGAPLNTAGSGGRLSVLTNGTLLINRVVGSKDHTDEGVYQCVAIISFDGETWTFVSRRARLQVAALSRFEQQPSDQNAFVDDVVVFPCKVEAVPLATVEWYKDNAPIDPTDHDRITVHPQTGTLEIRDVTHADRGNYKCKATNPERARHSTEGRLKVTKPDFLSDPTEPRFVLEPSGQVHREGDMAVLACAANGYPRPEFQWLKDQHVLDVEGDGRMRIVGQGTLVILKLKESDAGTYTCRATNAEDSTDASAAIEIQVGPSFEVEPEHSVSKETTDIEFECKAGGKPGPSVTWYKNGEIIIPSEYFVIDGPKLKVLGLVKTDQGVYQCLADNEAGSIQAAAQLIVQIAEYSYPQYYNNLYPDYEEKNGTTTETPEDHSEHSEPETDAGTTDSSQPPPSEPLDLRTTGVRSRYVTLEWGPPLRTNGELMGFSVFYKQEGSTRERVMKDIIARQVTVDKLLPSTVYYFRVVAFNQNGAGPSSTPLKVETEEEQAVPGKVQNLRGLAMSPDTIEIRWDPPLGEPVVGYRLFYLKVKNGDQDELDSTEEEETEINTRNTIYMLHGLDKFSTYAFRVEADGTNGPGLSSQVIKVNTVSDVPSEPPQDINVEAASSQTIVVTWRPPPEDARNGVITGYKIRYKQRGRGSKHKTFVTDGSVREHTISNLQPATNYVVKVGAITVNGTGPMSGWIKVQTVYRDKEENQVPGPPTSLRVQARSHSIMISWTPPLDDGIMIRGYLVGWGVNVPDVHQEKIDTSSRYYTIDGLDPNRDYVISLRAYNSIGNGFPIYETVRTLDPSRLPTDEDTEQGPPLPTPTGLIATTLSDTAIRLIWTDLDLPANLLGGPQRGSDGRHYNIKYTSYYENGGRFLYVNATETMYLVEHLKPNTQYEFAVRVVLGKRSSGWSMSAYNTTRTAAPSSAPRDLTAAVGPGNDPLTVMLNWQPPKHANGPIQEYFIYYSPDEHAKMQNWKMKDGIPGDRLTTTIDNLLPKTKYYFKIQARNEVGYSPLSRVISHMPGYVAGDATYVPNREQKNGGNDSKGTEEDQSTKFILIGIGSIIFLAIVLAVVVGLYCCRQKWSRRRAGYVAGKKSHAAKEVKPPPDLWINHQHDRDLRNRGNSPGSSMHDLKQTLYSQSPTSDTPRYHSLADTPSVQPVVERRVGRAKPMVMMPHSRKQSGSSMAMSDVEAGGTLTRSYHQSSGSLDIAQPLSGRQRTPQVVYTGPRSQQPAKTTVDFGGSHYGSGTLGLTPTPPPSLPNGAPPQAPPPMVTMDGSRTLPKRGGNPLKSFTAVAAPPPPPPAPSSPGATASPKTHVVRPVPITVVSSPHRSQMPANSSVMAGGKPAGIVIGTKMGVRSSPHPPNTSNGDLNETHKELEAEMPVSHSYSTEELNVQMQNLDTMIDDLQAMQKEFNVV